MGLKEYKRKRDFCKTPEPTGGTATPHDGDSFVVQKHAASRLHYDFRLELDGTLKSWAVPKGPHLDPSVKSLAVQVEDHPIEYGGFEGIIPQGEYGGGTVMVWDRGTWEPVGDAEQSFKSGKLKFKLHGEKLHGGWTLVRMGGSAGEGGKNWLLIKELDADARPNAKTDLLTRKPRSVLTNRTMDEIAADADRVWSSKPSSNGRAATTKQSVVKRKSLAADGRKRGSSKDLAKAAAGLTGARRASQPKVLRPQLATLAADVPTGERWVHELKFDGYRMLAFLDAGEARLVTRNGNDWTHRFHTIADALARLPVRNAVLDGEVVSLDDDGNSNFQQLQNSLKRGDSKSLVYYVFDLPYCEQLDLKDVPLLERKELLQQLLKSQSSKNDGPLRYSDHIRGQGEQIWQQACRSAMEGIISKVADSGYHQARTTDWLKVKCLKRQEFVIGGFTKPSGSRAGFGALLLGAYDDAKLIYCGRVGTGFTTDSLRQLKANLKSRVAATPPFSNPPRGAQARGVTWVKPELVCEVEFTQWTDEGILRHPSFKGLREDKVPRDVQRELPRKNRDSNHAASNGAPMKNGSRTSTTRTAKGNITADDESVVAGVRITHPDRVLFAEQNLTKLDLARYYESVADWILPYVANRPLTLVRCPSGPKGECFYQKHFGTYRPEAMRGVMIKEKSSRAEYMLIEDVAGLISIVQMGALEIHPWPARADDVERPDMLVFDLDPAPDVAWKNVVQGARDVREYLEQLGLVSFLRTSGGKGLHVVVPLARRNTWEEFKRFAKAVADILVAEHPTKYIATMSKAKRVGKVFIDYLRNQRGATAIASYSTRARSGAPVATPIAWDELSARIKPDTFRVKTLPKRLARLREDPWKGFFEVRQSITKKMMSKKL